MSTEQASATGHFHSHTRKRNREIVSGHPLTLDSALFFPYCDSPLSDRFKGTPFAVLVYNLEFVLTTWTSEFAQSHV